MYKMNMSKILCSSLTNEKTWKLVKIGSKEKSKTYKFILSKGMLK